MSIFDRKYYELLLKCGDLRPVRFSSKNFTSVVFFGIDGVKVIFLQSRPLNGVYVDPPNGAMLTPY